MSSVDQGLEEATVGIDVRPLVDVGLGNSAYLVDLGEGRGLVVDASLDLRSVRAAAEKQGLHVACAVDTHLHADFLTGAVQLAAEDGAQVIASARGGRDFPHVGLDDGDEVDLGALRLRALFTPGHTDEHLAYLLLDGQTPVGVFSGGSLIVGSAARTDLLGADRTDELTRAQYRSLQRLARLADDVAVWPTHGAGSFCSAPAGDRRTTTIGAEKARNPLLAAPDEDEVDLGGLRLRALFTPGHTDEHLSYLLLDGSTPLGVFSGGSLIVGSAARTDLLGAERTEELTRAQYRSLQRLARLGE